jgi:hypothetical protein
MEVDERPLGREINPNIRRWGLGRGEAEASVGRRFWWGSEAPGSGKKEARGWREGSPEGAELWETPGKAGAEGG